MARPKSDDKRKAILMAAAEVIAEKGIGAPTSAISHGAGVAEGTLFTYFKTKDELLNALYCEIKRKLAEAMLEDFPKRKSLRQRLQHVWNQYVSWGVEHGTLHRALRQVEVWGGLTEESRVAGMVHLTEIGIMVQEASERGWFRDLPEAYFSGAMQALAEMTMEFARNDPKNKETYRKAGFAMLCASARMPRS